METYSRLYVGEKAKKRIEEIMEELEREEYDSDVWLITLAANPRNQLDLFSVSELRHDYIRRNCPLIIGIASGRREAVKLVEKIAQESYEHTKGLDLRNYLLKDLSS